MQEPSVSLSERMGETFFLTSSLIGLIELFTAIYLFDKWPINVSTLSELLRGSGVRSRRARAEQVGHSGLKEADADCGGRGDPPMGFQL